MSDTDTGLNLFKQNPKALEAIDATARKWLLAPTCEPSRRGLAIEIAEKVLGKNDSDEVAKLIDQCLATRKKLEPTFRIWLGSQRRI